MEYRNFHGYFCFLKKNNPQYFVAHSSLILNYSTENALFYCGDCMTRGCQFSFEKNNILRNYREMNYEENIINICEKEISRKLIFSKCLYTQIS